MHVRGEWRLQGFAVTSTPSLSDTEKQIGKSCIRRKELSNEPVPSFKTHGQGENYKNHEGLCGLGHLHLENTKQIELLLEALASVAFSEAGIYQ